MDAAEHAESIKAWYEGYHFGDSDVYCPWDVMNYLWISREIQVQSLRDTGKIPVIMQSFVPLLIMPAAALQKSWKRCSQADILYSVWTKA